MMPDLARSTPDASPSPRIETCLAEFDVTAPQGPMSAPETLLDVVRREVLPALADVLEAPEWKGLNLTAEHIEIDLGVWPDDPVWSDVRYVLGVKLRAALELYVPHPVTDAQTETTPPTYTTPSKTASEQLSAPLPSALTPRPVVTSDHASDGPAQEAQGAEALAQASLREFVRWSHAQPLPIPEAEIMSWLSTHATEAAALTAWRAIAEDEARVRTLPVDRETQQAVITALKRMWVEPERPVGAHMPSLPDRIAALHQPTGRHPAAPTARSRQPDIPDEPSSQMIGGAAPPDGSSEPEASRAPDPDAAALRLKASFKRLGLTDKQAHLAANTALGHLVSSKMLVLASMRGIPFSSEHVITPELEGDGEVPRSQFPRPPVLRRMPGQVFRQSDPSAGPSQTGKEPVSQSRAGQDAGGSDGIVAHNAPMEGISTPTETPESVSPPALDADPRPETQSKLPQAVQVLARLFGGSLNSASIDHVRLSFMDNPSETFTLSATADLLGPLAALFSKANGLPAGMLILLDPAQLKLLNAADPLALDAAVERLTKAEALRLAQHLVPDGAELLGKTVVQLSSRAKAPKLALQQAALSLLRGHPIDLEALEKLSQQDGGHVAPEELRDASNTQADAGATQPPVSGTETPLEAILALSGLSRTDVDLVFGRRSHPDQIREQGLEETRKETLSPTVLDVIDAHLARLTGADNAVSPGSLEDTLHLLWEVWPAGQNAPPTDVDETPLARVRQRFAAPRAVLAAQILPAESFVQQLDHATQAFEPDPAKRTYGLRAAAARLTLSDAPQTETSRRILSSAISTLLAQEASKPVTIKTGPQRPIGQTKKTTFTQTRKDETELRITECAGLVLLHPFYPLLFERLKIARDGKALHRDDLPVALGALHHLAGTDGPADPLHHVLLGLDPSLVLPDPLMPEAPERDLMSGLLRSVVERWARLGATSPDGLRETFLRRTGTLQCDETGTHLRVVPGPFDMLLDSMPWRVGPVALPWMPLPCFVSWREAEDA